MAVLGKTEQFGFLDIPRALIYTPLIRLDRELHTPCCILYDTGNEVGRNLIPNDIWYRVITQDIVLVGSA